MKTTYRPNTITFTAKGQVVIPRPLRKEFEIEEGTRAVVEATPQGILLKPMTAKHYDSLMGRLKGKGILKALMEDRKREREL